MAEEHDALTHLLEFIESGEGSAGRVGTGVSPSYPPHVIELFVLLTVQWMEDLIKG